jgi:hypothetical protein
MSIPAIANLPTLPIPSLGVGHFPGPLEELMRAGLRPKAEQGVRRIIAGLTLARDRAIAHVHDPRAYPLPTDPHSLEQAMLTRMSQLDAAQQRKVIEAVLLHVRATGEARRQSYGELAPIDLSSSASVTEQIGRLQLPPVLSEADGDALRRVRLERQPAPRVFSRLELEIQAVTCVEKTRHVGEIDGRDEMSLATSVAGSGLAPVSMKVDLGRFGEGDRRAVPRSPFFSFNLGTVHFPVALTLQAALTEVDRGLTPPKEPIKGFVDALFGGAFGALFFGSLLPDGGSIILELASDTAAIATPIFISGAAAATLTFVAVFVAVVGAAGLIIHLFKRAGVDESYAPVTTGLALQSASDQPPEVGGPHTFEVAATKDIDGFSGHYRIDYAWHLK